MLGTAYRVAKALIERRSQSNETEVLARLTRGVPKTFVEFGFHPIEYNCIRLDDFRGLLIDGNARTVRHARWIFPRRLRVEQRFLTLENLDVIRNAFPNLWVLSIDVDGNDYWFLEALLPTRPHVAAVEYNASLGQRSITVPYDPAFDRFAKHSSGLYHGASLAALATLCSRYGMKLVAVSASGVNAFFVREDHPAPALDARGAYRECLLCNRWTGSSAVDQWERVKNLSYVEIR
ncbi:MAG: hypothetical protein ACREUT_06750 [Steroidobacteraceae bacterium]